MPRPFLIIDGYNLMHAAGMARSRYGPGQLQKQRNAFLAYLGRCLRRGERERTTVVFDAGDAPVGAPRTAIVDEMEIMFAPPGGDADTVIEQLVAAHSAPRQIKVVSSDRRLQVAARRRRGRFVGSDAFLEQLERRVAAAEEEHVPEDPQIDAKFSGVVPEEETAEWLEIFGESADSIETDERQSDVDFWQKRVDELADEERDD